MLDEYCFMLAWFSGQGMLWLIDKRSLVIAIYIDVNNGTLQHNSIALLHDVCLVGNVDMKRLLSISYLF